MSIKLKTTDSKDKIRYTVQGIDYRPLSLEGATVRFLMADKAKKTLILNESATIASASEGTVEYKLSDLSTLYPGTFNAEFHVEFADGSRKIVPAHGYIEVTISESLDASQTGEIEENIILEVSKIEEFKDEIVAEVDGFRTTIGQAQDATLEANEQAEYAKTQGDRAKVEADRVAGMDVSKLTAQLAETIKYQQQVDFVDFIKERVGYSRFRLKRISATMPEVVFDDGNKHVSYRFNKDTNDDFYKLSKVYVGDLTHQTVEKYDAKNPDDITGTWNVTSLTGKNWFTTDRTTPATIKGKVTGNNIVFHAFGDNRGGRWSFVIDGDTENPVIVSTYSAVGNVILSLTLAEGLEDKLHTIVGTFIGDDPANLPSTGAGTARGWAYVDITSTNRGTFSSTKKIENTESKRLLIDGSNKEFAFSIDYDGVTNWFPEHSGIGTAFKIEDIQYILDGKTLDYSKLKDVSFVEFKSNLVVKQHLNCTFSGVNIAEVWIDHYFNQDGSIKWTGKMKVLRPFRMVYGYPVMLPLANETFTEIITGIYNTKISDFSGDVFNFDEEKDFVHSCVSVDATNKDYIVACKIENPIKTMRSNETLGKPNTTKPMYLSQRSDFPKVYYVSHEAKDMSVGEIYNWSGQVIGATIKDAFGLVK